MASKEFLKILLRFKYRVKSSSYIKTPSTYTVDIFSGSKLGIFIRLHFLCCGQLRLIIKQEKKTHKAFNEKIYTRMLILDRSTQASQKP